MDALIIAIVRRLSPHHQRLAVALAWLAYTRTLLTASQRGNRGKEIVHIIPHIGLGGVQRQLELLLKNRSPAYNHRVVVIFPNDRFFAAELAECRVPVYYLDPSVVRDSLWALTARRRVRWILERILPIVRTSLPFCREIIDITLLLRALNPRPDVVHCWLLFANLVGSIAARFAGVPFVITSVRSIQSQVDLNYCDPQWQQSLERATIPLTNIITANAPAVAADYRAFTKAPAEKVVIIPNGIDVNRFRFLKPEEREARRRELGLTTDHLVVGTVARIAKEKDLGTFIRTIALARCTLVPLQCVVVGDGPLRADLEFLASSLGVAELVQFVGERKDVGDLIQCFDVFLLTSIVEGMPNAVLESQLLGVAVVATKAGGTVDLIRDGETGLLAPIGDAETLASCVVKMLTDQHLRDRICRAAREQVRNNYRVEQLVARTEKIYLDLLDGNCRIGKHGREG